jgi:hypothetical protein
MPARWLRAVAKSRHRPNRWVGSLASALKEHLIEVCQIPVVIAEPREGSVEVLADDGHGVGMLIRWSTSEKLKSGGGQRVLVGTPVGAGTH